MLQQTQVATVLPRYGAWFERFPDIDALSVADLDEVLKAWEGLGYYRRARFMHAAAQQIVAQHSGCFPATLEAITALPGIGRSTAGAIASFCFGASTPVLDGNVKRVLSRWHALPAATDKRLWPLAQDAIDASGDPATWNQAMMELGATLCQPKPDCEACPLLKHCASAFKVERAREKKGATPVRDVHWQVRLHTCPEKGIWLTRRPDHGIWAELWSPPISELHAAPDSPADHIHLLTHRRIHLYTEIPDGEPTGDGQWVANMDHVSMPTGIHRLLDKQGVKA